MGRKKPKKIAKAKTRFSGKNLNPHSFDPIVNTSLQEPKIFITPLAHQKMEAYIKLSPIEISWLGTVSQIGIDFLIEDVFLPKQENSAASTEMSEEGLVDIAEELLKQENGVELCNMLRFWGHSHVSMNTGPSGQDEKQLRLLMRDIKGNDSFFIRAIGNKKGKLQFTIFLYGGLISIDDIAWEIYLERDDTLIETIKAEIEEKVEEEVFVAPYFRKKDYQNLGYWEDGTYYPGQVQDPDYPGKEVV